MRSSRHKSLGQECFASREKTHLCIHYPFLESPHKLFGKDFVMWWKVMPDPNVCFSTFMHWVILRKWQLCREYFAQDQSNIYLSSRLKWNKTVCSLPLLFQFKSESGDCPQVMCDSLHKFFVNAVGRNFHSSLMSMLHKMLPPLSPPSYFVPTFYSYSYFSYYSYSYRCQKTPPLDSIFYANFGRLIIRPKQLANCRLWW